MQSCTSVSLTYMYMYMYMCIYTVHVQVHHNMLAVGTLVWPDYMHIHVHVCFRQTTKYTVTIGFVGMKVPNKT